MSYRVGIVQRDNAVDGWVFDLPGCRAIGANREACLALLPAAIAEHLVWLRGHGEAVDPSDAAYEIVEEVTSSADLAFEDDKRPLSVEELEVGIQRSELAYVDLFERGRLPDVLLDWRVPASAVKIELYPDVRSIRDMVLHASGSSGFFTRNLDNDWQPPAISGPADVPQLRAAVFRRLRDLTPEERAGVFRREVRGAESVWTARKLIRRLINHERFHAKEIEQRLAWLLLAVPDVMPASRE